MVTDKRIKYISLKNKTEEYEEILAKEQEIALEEILKGDNLVITLRSLKQFEMLNVDDIIDHYVYLLEKGNTPLQARHSTIEALKRGLLG